MLLRLRERRVDERKPALGTHIQIGQRMYTVRDISTSGLYVSPYNGSLMPEERFDFTLHLLFWDGPYQMKLRGRVVRFDRSGLAISFGQPRGQDGRRLRMFLQA